MGQLKESAELQVGIGRVDCVVPSVEYHVWGFLFYAPMGTVCIGTIFVHIYVF